MSETETQGEPQGEKEVNPNAESLAIKGLASIDAGLSADLSPLGSVFFRVATTAISFASGKPFSALDSVSVGAELLSAASPIYSELLDTIAVSAGAAGVGVIADVLPIVGQAAGMIASMASAQIQAEQEQQIAACVGGYLPPLQGTGLGGEVVPADIFGTTNYKGIEHAPMRPLPHSDVGRLFYYVAEDTIPTISPDGVKRFPSYASPDYIAYARAKLMKSASLFGGPKPSAWDGAMGIPSGTRKTLANLRGAMTLSRGVGPDGGKMTLPVYLDLLWTQFRAKRLTKSFVWHVFTSEVSSDECAQYDQRAFDAFWEMLRSWKLTIEPTYGIDQAKLRAFLESIGSKKTMVPLSRFGPMAKVHAATKSLTHRGIKFRRIDPHLASALGKPSVQTPLPDRDQILALVAAAAKGNTRPAQEAQASVAAQVKNEHPESTVEALEAARTLVLAALDGDPDAEATIEGIAYDAERGDQAAIEALGFIVAVIDGLDRGTVDTYDPADLFGALGEDEVLNIYSNDGEDDEESPAYYGPDEFDASDEPLDAEFYAMVGATLAGSALTSFKQTAPTVAPAISTTSIARPTTTSTVAAPAPLAIKPLALGPSPALSTIANVLRNPLPKAPAYAPMPSAPSGGGAPETPAYAEPGQYEDPAFESYEEPAYDESYYYEEPYYEEPYDFELEEYGEAYEPQDEYFYGDIYTNPDAIAGIVGQIELRNAPRLAPYRTQAFLFSPMAQASVSGSLYGDGDSDLDDDSNEEPPWYGYARFPGYGDDDEYPYDGSTYGHGWGY